MSDQTPPPPVPPLPPMAPPTPPYTGQPYTGQPYTGQPYAPSPPHPSAPSGAPYPNAPAGYTGYPPAGHDAGTAQVMPAAKKPGGLGLVALLLALAAAVVAPLVGAVAAFQVGAGAQLDATSASAWADLSFLSPVREWVLLGEIAFWAGTVLGIWAIVQGIVAIVKRRGLGTGIAAIVVAVFAVVIFGTVVYGAAIAGVVSSYDLGGTTFSA